MSQPSIAKLVTPTEADIVEEQLALPAPEPVMEEAPLEVQGAPLESLEAQSLMLMI